MIDQASSKPEAVARKRIMAGMRPTGDLHVGHLLGALLNFVDLSRRHECFFEVADLHALTTKFERSGEIAADIRKMVTGWIAAGLDPDACTIYVQSQVPEISELYVLLSMIVPVSWLERVPTYKELVSELGTTIATHGFFGYPVLQTVDIAIMKGQGVPVGQDQLPHVELSREIVRRFNHLYGKVLIEPEAILSETPYVPGTDGRKMSKSYDNSIMLSESPEQTLAKVKTMYTDPTKIRKNDPGHPETCPVFFLQEAFNAEGAPEIARRCRSGELGCVEDKADMARRLNEALAPIRDRFRELDARPGYVDEILFEGTKRARTIAHATLAEVKAAMGLY